MRRFVSGLHPLPAKWCEVAQNAALSVFPPCACSFCTRATLV